MRRAGLEVWLDEHEVGWLRPVGADEPGSPQGLSFAYLARWTAEVLAYPLAPSLPLPARGGPGSESQDDAVLRCFDRLLPDGALRRATFSALGLAADDGVGALRRLGHDLAGAVRLVDTQRERSAGPSQRLIAREELSERLRHPDASPLAAWDGQVRGALPGRRDKLGVYVEPDGGWYLVDGPQMASTHVLKPAPPDEPDRPFNEYFCMRLAARAGLDVAAVQLHRVPEPLLLVERFDRQRLDDGRVRRLHAIDARQALDQPAASLPTLFSLLRHSPTPLVDSRSLLRWVVFRQLIGSGPASLDNVCFLVDHGGLRLAPAHGLTGGAPDAQAFGADEWAALARDADIAPRALALELKRMSEALRVHAQGLAEEMTREFAGEPAGDLSRSAIDSVLAVVQAQGDRQAALAPDIAR